MGCLKSLIHKPAYFWLWEEIDKPENPCKHDKSTGPQLVVLLMLYFGYSSKIYCSSVALTSQWGIARAICLGWNWATWYTDSRTLEVIVLLFLTLIAYG